MRVLLLGAGGMLARDVARTAPDSVTLITRTSAEVDITDRDQLTSGFEAARPDVVINAAAYTRVDDAERDRDRAFLVNGTGVGYIGQVSADLAPDSLVVHFSTDYVFNGTIRRPYREDDQTAPIGIYGESKLAGEKALSASGARHLIIRTQWLFGQYGRSFPRTMWERAVDRRPTRVVNDQVGRPTSTRDLARAIWTLLRAARRLGHISVLHVANTGHATWYDVAAAIFASKGASDLLSPCSTADFPTRARRPTFSVLDTTAFEALTHRALPPWRESVLSFCESLQPYRQHERPSH